jgi:cell division protein ZapA
VAMVDREMSAIRDAGRVKARERIAVLTALNLAYLRAEGARNLPPTPPSPVPATEAPPQPAASAAHAAKEVALPATATRPEPLEASDAVVVERLIARLDRVLGDDGRLL